MAHFRCSRAFHVHESVRTRNLRPDSPATDQPHIAHQGVSNTHIRDPLSQGRSDSLSALDRRGCGGVSLLISRLAGRLKALASQAGRSPDIGLPPPKGTATRHGMSWSAPRHQSCADMAASAGSPCTGQEFEEGDARNCACFKRRGSDCACDVRAIFGPQWRVVQNLRRGHGKDRRPDLSCHLQGAGSAIRINSTRKARPKEVADREHIRVDPDDPSAFPEGGSMWWWMRPRRRGLHCRSGKARQERAGLQDDSALAGYPVSDRTDASTCHPR